MSASIPDTPAGSPEELSAAFARALADGEIDRALGLWLEDAAILGAAGEALRGREAIGGALRALVDNGTEVEIELTRTITAGDVAIGLGTLTLSGSGAGGEPFRQRSASAVVYSRGADGCWRIAIDAPWGLPGA